MREKPDGFDCFEADGDGNEHDSDGDDSDGLLDVLLAGVGEAGTGVKQRWFGNGGGATVNDSLRIEPP